jgi:signal transduction histidine kinase
MSRPWVLPLLLAAAQLAVWPGARLLGGTPIDPGATAAGVGLILTAAAALYWRRRWPVMVAGGVFAVGAVTSATPWADNLWMPVVAGLVAFYNVAVHRPLRRAAVAGGVLVTAQVVREVLADGEDPVAAALSVVVLYGLVGVLGWRGHRWRGERAAAAQRLAEAQRRGREAAETERHRLARELHDVSAHHLTSIVVTASAAQRLADRRPELVGEALEFSARTGRDTLAALHRLVAVMDARQPVADGPARRLEDLAAGFRRLGHRLDLDVDAGTERLPAPVADAVYGIAREALTNTARYAQGSAVVVQVTCEDGGVRLLVEDDGPAGAPAAAPAAAGLGSGRGTAGMRERAAGVGGTLTTGPRSPAGWRVCAELPPTPTPAPRSGTAGTWRRWTTHRRLDAMMVAANAAVPIVAVPLMGEWRVSPGVAVLFVLWAVAHAVPLAHRRRRPWEVLAAVLALQWVWLAVVVALPVTADAYVLVGAVAVAETVAVYAVARHGTPARFTWLAAVAATAAQAGYLAVSLVRLVPREPGATQAENLVGLTLVGVVVALVSAVSALMPMMAVWGLGHAVGRRRESVRMREHDAVAVAVAAATATAVAERSRIAAGLRAAVLERTGQVTAEALRGDLDGVLGQARGALAAMRGLLDDLRPREDSRTPLPGTPAIADLCERHRQAGRAVTFDVADTGRPLPPDVGASAYRVVEVALAAGDRRPAHAWLRYEQAWLRVTVTGVPAATDDVTVTGLRARVTALGGTIAVDPSGTIDVSLPVPAGEPLDT